MKELAQTKEANNTKNRSKSWANCFVSWARWKWLMRAVKMVIIVVYERSRNANIINDRKAGKLHVGFRARIAIIASKPTLWEKGNANCVRCDYGATRTDCRSCRKTEKRSRTFFFSTLVCIEKPAADITARINHFIVYY